jgi:hypothetical protein
VPLLRRGRNWLHYKLGKQQKSALQPHYAAIWGAKSQKHVQGILVNEHCVPELQAASSWCACSRQLVHSACARSLRPTAFMHTSTMFLASNHATGNAAHNSCSGTPRLAAQCCPASVPPLGQTPVKGLGITLLCVKSRVSVRQAGLCHGLRCFSRHGPTFERPSCQSSNVRRNVRLAGLDSAKRLQIPPPQIHSFIPTHIINAPRPSTHDDLRAAPSSSTHICTWAEPRLWALGAPSAPAAAIHGGPQLVIQMAAFTGAMISRRARALAACGPTQQV